MAVRPLARLLLLNRSAIFPAMPATKTEKTAHHTTSDWETLCKRCGECCFEKAIDKKGNILTLAVPCRFLDIHSRECRIYHQRQQAEEDCIKLTPEVIPELDWLPQGCAYRIATGNHNDG